MRRSMVDRKPELEAFEDTSSVRCQHGRDELDDKIDAYQKMTSSRPTLVFITSDHG